jgi:hypothetical protein
MVPAVQHKLHMYIVQLALSTAVQAGEAARSLLSCLKLNTVSLDSSIRSSGSVYSTMHIVYTDCVVYV